MRREKREERGERREERGTERRGEEGSGEEGRGARLPSVDQRYIVHCRHPIVVVRRIRLYNNLDRPHFIWFKPLA